MKALKKFFLMACMMFLGTSSYAQLNGNNFVQYQSGNIPEVEPRNLSTLYSQTNLLYKHKKLRASLRIESFNTSDTFPDSYLKLSQFKVQYRHKKWKLEAGNFYETLGRGLLLRTYEIKGSVIEDRIFREPKGFYKDLQGASVQYNGKIFAFTALRGKPLVDLLPIDDPLRRNETIEAINPKMRFLNQQIGIIGLRHFENGEQTSFLSFHAEGNLPLNIGYYAEYASTLRDSSEVFKRIDTGRQGIYLGLNYSIGTFGASFEIKDYKNFFIGSGISSPPTLVKEHNYRLLNRSTHLPELSNERGVQAELFYGIGNNLITLNYSQGINKLFKIFKYYEYFAEYAHNSFDNVKFKVFIDIARNDAAQERNRYAGGLYSDFILFSKHQLSVETEFQQIERRSFETEFYKNTSINTIYSVNDISVSVLWETTSDSFENPDGITHFLGSNINYRINKTFELSVFGGKRQGGPACSSGVCYEVLDFEGVEIRLTTKFI
jgi:hypothetical protein